MQRLAQQGLTLIELLVGMTLVALLMVVAAPTLGDWLTNARLRGTAEALGASLHFAKGEAVARNARVRFQLTSALDGSCALSTAGPHWVVNLDPDADPAAVVGQCDADLSDTTAPRLLSRHHARENGAGTVIEANTATLVFNGLGRLTPVPAGEISIDVRSADDSRCVAAGGTLSCMRVLVSALGQVRVCNPAVAAPHPGAC
jgi:type IV fimbrial biogenesis protein FimT